MQTDVIALLWREETGARPGPKPKLSLDQVIDAGIAIADADGLDAVTMQAVADRLDATKMALYRYVPGKAELAALMLDGALGEPPQSRGRSWRSALMVWATTFHERTSSRPWSVELAQKPHPPGPCELRWSESGLTALRDVPLLGAEKLDVLALLVGHISGIVRQESAGAAPESALAAAVALVLDRHADEYPLTRSAFAGAGGRNDALVFGLERILDGVHSLIEGREGKAPNTRR